ncbi:MULTISPECIES: helix-turn-helix transcriptional regulator [Halobacteriovorax]|uniref:helix-turn-helix transcriptional regulator n=1 Tax=Halobacteriovorax TaxID=1652133 RepID=UPI001314FF74|nr:MULTISPECIES: helix-turn-helix transcriptional regulator [Halobacteriovorax]
MRNENKIEALALKKLRGIKGVNRREAGVLLGVSFKTIEKFENGRTALTRSKIDEILSGYGFSYDDFNNCCNGKSDKVKAKFVTIPKVIENKKLRRSYKRVITKEAQVLKAIRKLKGLSQYKASFLCGYHKTAIGHIENGRVEIPKSRIQHILEAYGFTMDDFDYHMKSEVFVTEIQDDCISIIRSLGEDKLKAVYPLLSTFKN